MVDKLNGSDGRMLTAIGGLVGVQIRIRVKNNNSLFSLVLIIIMCAPWKQKQASNYLS